MLLRSRLTDLGNGLLLGLMLSFVLHGCLALEEPSSLENDFGTDSLTDSDEISDENILGDASYDDDEAEITASDMDNEVI